MHLLRSCTWWPGKACLTWSLGRFCIKGTKTSPFHEPLVNAETNILSFASSIEKAFLFNHVMYDLSILSSRCLMLIRHAMDLLYRYLLMKCEANCALSSLKVLMELGINLLNHTLASPFNVIGNPWHMILFRTPCKCLRVLNDSK